MIMPKPKPGDFSRSLVVLIESRLRDLRLSIHAAEKQYGFPPETLRSVIRGSSPSVDRFKQICDALSIDFSLGAGAGIANNNSTSGSVGVRVPLREHRVAESRDFPIVGIVRAGSDIEYWNDQFPGGELVSAPGELLGFSSKRTSWGGVVVRGDSMSPVFEDSDILFIDLCFSGTPSELLGRACVVETRSGVAMVKRLERGRKGGFYNLESYNRLHSVIVDIELRTARPVLWVKKG